MILLVAFWLTYLIIPVLLWTLARWLGKRSAVASSDVDATRCGRCGYDVRALPTNVCPECGSDLDVVGRVTPRSSRRRRWASRLVLPLWTMLIVLLGFGFSLAAAFHFLPRRQVGWSHQPMVTFVGQQFLDWRSLVVLDNQWEMDESPRPFAGWYPSRVRKGTLTSADASRSGTNGVAAGEPAIDWDAVNDRWSYQKSIGPTQRGSGFPPQAILVQWAHDVAARRPARKPLSDNELMGLAVAGGTMLANSTGNGGVAVPAQWRADRNTLLRRGAATITWAMFGAQFRNSIVPMWPPLAAGGFEWLVLLLLSLRSLRRNV